MQFNFFEQNFCKAIGAGIYEISICKNNKEAPLYIGESVFVLVRCGYHLYRLKQEPEYFGFEKSIEDKEYADVTLKFSLICDDADVVGDSAKRKAREKELINETGQPPLTQSGYSDRQKKREEKIAAVTEFLKQAE